MPSTLRQFAGGFAQARVDHQLIHAVVRIGQTHALREDLRVVVVFVALIAQRLGSAPKPAAFLAASRRLATASSVTLAPRFQFPGVQKPFYGHETIGLVVLYLLVGDAFHVGSLHWPYNYSPQGTISPR
jgi:hypothetical protein